MPTGSKPTQSIPEMLSDMAQVKERGLDRHRRGKSIYKVQSGEYKKEKLQELLSVSLSELALMADRKQVSLADTAEIKKRTIFYLRACQESGTFPTMMGFARSLGYSARGLERWRQRNAQTESGQWLETLSEMCAEVMTQSALKNDANPVVSIFLSKALYGLVEQNELVIKPGSAEPPPETGYSEADIRKRYELPPSNGSAET